MRKYMAALAVAALVACGKGDVTGPSEAPQPIVSTTPAPVATTPSPTPAARVKVEVIYDEWGPGMCHSNGGTRTFRITNNTHDVIYSRPSSFGSTSIGCGATQDSTGGKPKITGKTSLDPGEVGEVSYYVDPPACGRTQVDDTWGPSEYGIFVVGDVFNSDVICKPPTEESACIPLGAGVDFAVLASSTVTSTGPTVVTGDLGLYPGTSVTGFPPGIVNGVQEVANGAALTAMNSANTTYNMLSSIACDKTLSADLGGMTLTPGTYCLGAAGLTGTLTLDAQGNPGATWVFKMESSLIVGSGGAVVFINGANSCGVSWRVGSSATLGTSARMVGNIIAKASITLNTGASLAGRAFALTGAVTLDSNNAVSIAGCTVCP